MFISLKGTAKFLNPCVNYKKVKNGQHVYLLLCVDMLIAFHGEDEIKRLKSLLASEFEKKDMDTIEKILRW